MKRIFSLLIALFLALGGPALADPVSEGPMAVVSFQSAMLDGWTPSYGTALPGLLLEMSHPEAMLSVSAAEKNGLSPSEYLSARLDQAGESLSVSNAQIAASNVFGEDCECLTYRYTYLGGDEEHDVCILVWTWNGMLLELSIDVWGFDAQTLMNDAYTAFIENEFSVVYCAAPIQITGMLNDVIEGEDGLAQVKLGASSEAWDSDAAYYPLAPDAVVLFPNPDDPSLKRLIAPDMASLVDAILTYEENSDILPMFSALISEGSIVFMEYAHVQQ